MANYMLIGAEELGTEIFHVENGRMTLDFNEEVAKKLWDGYYVPYVKGYFSASGWFRSDDIKTGNIIGYVGSTGWSTGPHLHYEVTLNGTRQNPENYVSGYTPAY